MKTPDVYGLDFTADATFDRDRNRIEHMRFTPPQFEFMMAPDPAVVWIDGNQVGKTTALLCDIIHRCRGTHPYQSTQSPPINVLILGFSVEQMSRPGAIMQKLWELLPKDEIDPIHDFTPGKGLNSKYPSIRFVSGPGAGSIIAFGTYRQDPTTIAGATVHLVALDEPPPQLVFEEALPRLLRHGGVLRIVFTPQPSMPPQDHMLKLIELREVIRFTKGLCEAHCWPKGDPLPWLNQEQIDTMARLLPEHIRKMRIEGVVKPIVANRYLSAFFPHKHVMPFKLPRGADLAVGIDHGAQSGKQGAVLCAFSGLDTLHPCAWYVDETMSDGRSSPKQDAEAIRDMLGRHRLSYRHVDLWIGDRSLSEPTGMVAKSNTKLRQHLAVAYGCKASEIGTFYTPRKGWGSEANGLALMNALFADEEVIELPDGTEVVVQRVKVHPRCVHLVKSMSEYKGPRTSPLKDIMDAARYPTERAVGTHPLINVVGRYT